MKRLRKDLKIYLKKEKFLVDVILFGSALKSKPKPRDIDLFILCRKKDYKKIEEIIYNCVLIGRKNKLNVHCEPLIIDEIFNAGVFVTLLHEGESIKKGKSISQALGAKSYVLVKYELRNKKNSEKVMFSYALYGRKRGGGLLAQLGGEELGKGVFLVPTSKFEIIKGFSKQWKVNFKALKIMVFNN